MEIIIVGAGTAGFQIAKQLISEKKNVVLIDKDPLKAKYASNNLDCMVINDEGNNYQVLKQAGINKADFFISVTNSDEVNMVSCGMVSSEFKVPYKIARVRNIDYFNTRILEKPFLGIDYIVNPEVEAAKAIIKTVEYGALSDIFLFEETKLQIRNIIVAEKSSFAEKSIKAIKQSIKVDFLIAGIMRNDQFIIPDGNTVVQAGDTLYLIASNENYEKIYALIGIHKTSIKRIVLVGGGKIGQYIADFFLPERRDRFSLINKLIPTFLQTKKINIKIIDNNYEKCKILSERFPNALVINADISDEDLFEEEQLYDSDLIITTTTEQELNILAAIYGKTMGIKRAIAVVNQNNYIKMASKLGLDAIISPKNSLVNPILKYIRKGNIKNVYSISDGEVEIIELLVDSSSMIAGKKVETIKMPDHSLVLFVSRENQDYIPDGQFTIQSGDVIIVIARKESIYKIEKMVAG